jgi:LMBR1 domain-containing protein 1
LINCSISDLQRDDAPVKLPTNCIIKEVELKIDVSFIIYVIGFLSFISWFIFVIFGGIGLAALPLDLIYDFCNRPRKLSPYQMQRKRKEMFTDINSLNELAKEVKAMEMKGAKAKSSKICFVK